MGKGVNLESVRTVGHSEEIDNVKLIMKPKFFHIKRKKSRKKKNKIK